MTSHSFKPIDRPKAIEPDFSLDEELEKQAEDASLTLHFINMVVVKGSNLTDVDLWDKSDPYCSVTVGELTDYTSVIQNDLNPVWNEKMQFFVPKKPESMLIQVLDKDAGGKDDLIGKYTFNFNDMFEKRGEFEGDVKLINDKKKPGGSVTLRVVCRIMKPIETEIKLGHTAKQLECKIAEKEATEAVLDESEKLRKDAIDQLSEKEQEIIKKAEELVEQQRLHGTELSAKDEEILNKAGEIESKIQEIEEVQLALQTAELVKKETETKLTEAEKEIVRKGEELEEKEKRNAAALTEKEKALLEAAHKLEEKEKANNEVKMQLEKVDALKKEVENELTAKETIIMNQAAEIEAKSKQSSELLSAKEQEILAAGLALQEKEKLAKQAQIDQDKALEELKLLQQAQKEFKSQSTNEISELRAALKKDQAQIDALTNKCKSLENENNKLNVHLASDKKGCFGLW